jgi:hypothetical protein
MSKRYGSKNGDRVDAILDRVPTEIEHNKALEAGIAFQEQLDRLINPSLKRRNQAIDRNLMTLPCVWSACELCRRRRTTTRCAEGPGSPANTAGSGRSCGLTRSMRQSRGCGRICRRP